MSNRAQGAGMCGPDCPNEPDGCKWGECPECEGADASSNRVFPCSRNCTSAAEAGCSYPDCVDAIPNSLTPAEQRLAAEYEAEVSRVGTTRNRVRDRVEALRLPNPMSQTEHIIYQTVADVLDILDEAGIQ